MVLEFYQIFRHYLTSGNLICFINDVAQPDNSKSNVDPSSFEIASVPNGMNQLHVPKIWKIMELLDIIKLLDHGNW